MNKSELRSFLGMTNFSAPFIRDYSQKTFRLRQLLQKSARWQWTDDHQLDFLELKKSLEEKCMLQYFDPERRTEIVCDGSPLGLSAMLTQIDKNSGYRHVVQYASRSLTKAETSYGQIEREAMAILFGCLKFQVYLLGKSFNVITDHMPLVSMLNNPRSQMPYRVDRVRLKLQGFDFVVKHMPGKYNPSDYMSRHPDKISEEDTGVAKLFEEYVHSIVDHPGDAISMNDIKNGIERDEELKKLRECVKRGRFDDLDERILKYKKVFGELSLVDGVILKADKILIPGCCVNDVLTAAHEGHQGIVKTKQLLRSRIWFPGIDKQVEDMISKCLPCQVSIPEKRSEPLKIMDMPDGPWQHLASDLHGPTQSGDYVLVVMDEYSRFAEVEFVKSTSARSVIPKLDKMFSSFGIPFVIKSDNGAPYNGADFKNYMKYMGISHRRITPLYPQANGLVENFNKNIEKLIHTSNAEGKNWKQEIFKFLRNYRATPHTTTGRAPADLIFQKREFRVRLPQLAVKIADIGLTDKEAGQKSKMKFYADRKSTIQDCSIAVNDSVLLKQKRLRKCMPYYESEPYKVIERKGNMISAKRGGRTVTRNSSFFKKVNLEKDGR